MHGRRVHAAEAPGDDHERRDEPDRRQREQDDVRLAPLGAARPRGRHAPGRANRRVLLADDEARVVLVDVELAVEPEILRVGAEEALDVGVRGEQLEALVLQRPQVLAPDLGAVLRVGELDVAAQTGLAEAVSDLEHGRIVAAVSLAA